MAEFNIKSNDINLNGLQNIEGSTPIRNYPSVQNANNEELKRMIQNLQNLIVERDAYIDKLRSDFIKESNRLKAEYASILDPDKITEDGEYVLEVKRTGNKLEYKWVRK